MSDPLLTEGMRHAAEEDDNTGNHLQANYLRVGADEINRLRGELAADPEDDAQCTIAAQAICKIRFTPNGDGCECATGGPYVQSCGCEKIARAVLTALRDAARGAGG